MMNICDQICEKGSSTHIYFYVHTAVCQNVLVWLKQHVTKPVALAVSELYLTNMLISQSVENFH